MAFQTGTSSSIENLMTQLSTFLQANGWTQDYYNSGDGGTIGFSKNNVYVGFQWTEATDGGTLAIYQALGAASTTTQPWTGLNDSGSGTASTTATNFDTQRCCNVFAGPHTGYWFFENDANPAYCHVVVEVDAGRFRHFGFGECVKIGDWTGGEYCYGHYWNPSSARIDVPNSSLHNMGMDAGNFSAGAGFGGTMHIEGHKDEPSVDTKWAVTFWGTSTGNDRDGNPRWPMNGGWRGGRDYGPFAGLRISPATAYKPLFPMGFEIVNFTPNPDKIYRVGYQPDVRMCNIGNIDPGQVINVAGDDWYFFPWVRKQYLNNDTEESWNGGVAYRRVNA